MVHNLAEFPAAVACAYASYRISGWFSAVLVQRGAPCCGASFYFSTQEYYVRSEEHTSELHSLMRSSYAVCCLKQIRPATSAEIKSELQLQMLNSYALFCSTQTNTPDDKP